MASPSRMEDGDGGVGSSSGSDRSPPVGRSSSRSPNMTDRDDENAALLSDPDFIPLASGHDGDATSSSASPAMAENHVRAAIAAEHALTPLEAIRAYPSAIFWSLMVSMCVIMEGMLFFFSSSFYSPPLT